MTVRVHPCDVYNLDDLFLHLLFVVAAGNDDKIKIKALGSDAQ